MAVRAAGAVLHPARKGELHACDLLAGRGLLAKNGSNNERVTVEQGARSFSRVCAAWRTPPGAW